MCGFIVTSTADSTRNEQYNSAVTSVQRTSELEEEEMSLEYVLFLRKLTQYLQFFIKKNPERKMDHSVMCSWRFE